MTTRELHKSYISYIKLALFSDKKNYATGKKNSGTVVVPTSTNSKGDLFHCPPPLKIISSKKLIESYVRWRKDKRLDYFFENTNPNSAIFVIIFQIVRGVRHKNVIITHTDLRLSAGNSKEQMFLFLWRGILLCAFRIKPLSNLAALHVSKGLSIN